MFSFYNRHNNNLYNKLVEFSRNIFFYKDLNLKDNFETRIILIFLHFSIILLKYRKVNKEKFPQEIFDNMDPAFAAGFIRELDGVKAGMILAEMDTDNSYKISVLIANRNASWRQASNKN